MLRFLRYDESIDDWTGFDEYFDFLARFRSRLGEDLYEFARDPERYQHSSSKSLYGAQLMQLRLGSIDLNDQPQRMRVELDLASEARDRILRLRYEGVDAHQLSQSSRGYGRPQELIAHEIHVNAATDGIEHYLEFDDGMSLFIACRLIQFEEIMLADGKWKEVGDKVKTRIRAWPEAKWSG